MRKKKTKKKTGETYYEPHLGSSACSPTKEWLSTVFEQLTPGPFLVFVVVGLGEKTQTEVVRARHKIICTGQDYPTGNSSRRETKSQTEETM